MLCEVVQKRCIYYIVCPLGSAEKISVQLEDVHSSYLEMAAHLMQHNEQVVMGLDKYSNVISLSNPSSFCHC